MQEEEAKVARTVFQSLPSCTLMDMGSYVSNVALTSDEACMPEFGDDEVGHPDAWSASNMGIDTSRFGWRADWKAFTDLLRDGSRDEIRAFRDKLRQK